MLVLRRKVGVADKETIMVGDRISLRLTAVVGGEVEFHIDAPLHVIEDIAARLSNSESDASTCPPARTSTEV